MLRLESWSNQKKTICLLSIRNHFHVPTHNKKWMKSMYACMYICSHCNIIANSLSRKKVANNIKCCKHGLSFLEMTAILITISHSMNAYDWVASYTAPMSNTNTCHKRKHFQWSHLKEADFKWCPNLISKHIIYSQIWLCHAIARRVARIKT